MLVARLMTISCLATAPRTESDAKRSTYTAAAPIRSSSARFSGVRATAVTRCPAATRRGTTLRPTTPVAPAMKIRRLGSGFDRFFDACTTDPHYFEAAASHPFPLLDLYRGPTHTHGCG